MQGEEQAAFGLMIMNSVTLLVLPFFWIAIKLITKYYSKGQIEDNKDLGKERVMPINPAELKAQQLVWKYSLLPGLALVIFFIPAAYEYLGVVYLCYALFGIPNTVFVLMPYVFLEVCFRNRRIGKNTIVFH